DRDVPAAVALARINAPDLYIACGCLHGEPRALAIFAEHFLDSACLALTRIDPAPHFREEVRQRVQERLLVGEQRLRQYRGQGSLAGWLRTAALREGLRLRERARVHDHAVAALRHDAPLPLDGELALMKTRYAGEVQAAVQEALAQLSAEEKHLLRLH